MTVNSIRKSRLGIAHRRESPERDLQEAIDGVNLTHRWPLALEVRCVKRLSDPAQKLSFELSPGLFYLSTVVFCSTGASSSPKRGVLQIAVVLDACLVDKYKQV